MWFLLLLLARWFGLSPDETRRASVGRDGAGIVRGCAFAAAEFLLASFEAFVAEGGIELSADDAAWADAYLRDIETCARLYAPHRAGALRDDAPLSLRALLERLKAAMDVLSGAASTRRASRRPALAARAASAAPCMNAPRARALELSG